MKRYGYTRLGIVIAPPKGWRIVPEGATVPAAHREYVGTLWAAPRRCHSTMTPITARVWGDVLAYAEPEVQQ